MVLLELLEGEAGCQALVEHPELAIVTPAFVVAAFTQLLDLFALRALKPVFQAS
ncbi:hypothetical protein LCGC14_0444410 [marine sediment metagenome]|uniref:Uncharacterized protein n=1 Tax=marine sediment metagenome TaxID=412755 RepID=A0A0F9T2S5_9ZZZZ